MVGISLWMELLGEVKRSDRVFDHRAEKVDMNLSTINNQFWILGVELCIRIKRDGKVDRANPKYLTTESGGMMSSCQRSPEVV